MPSSQRVPFDLWRALFVNGLSEVAGAGRMSYRDEFIDDMRESSNIDKALAISYAINENMPRIIGIIGF